MSFTTNIDETLKDIAESITLNDSRIQKFKSSYNAVLDLLKKDEEFFAKYEKLINIFPQGSARLGTTIKPENDDFDLDLVIHIDLPYQNFSFQDIYKHLWRVLSTDGTYSSMVSKKKRCIRIDYKSDNYHMDILPALSFDQNNKNRLAVPDRKEHKWTVSNPEGFAEWFKKKATFIIMQEDFSRALDTSEFTKSNDNPLKSAIKILKMYRNQYYIGEKEELKLPSIIITTLAAHSYNNGTLISTILKDFIAYCKKGRKYGSIYHFCNPIEENEIYSERWEDNPEIYHAFTGFLDNLEKQLNQLAQEKDDTLRESIIKSMVSVENYDSGFRYFSENQKRLRKANNDFDSLKVLSEPKTPFHKPYLG